MTVKEEAILAYKNGESTPTIARRIGVSPPTVSYWLKAANIRRRSYSEALNLTHGTVPPTENEVKEISNQYLSGKSIEKVGKIFGRCPSSIRKILLSEDILRTVEDARKVGLRRTVNEAVFDDLDNEAASYFIGFIAGDGNVYKNTITVGLHNKDVTHLEKMKEFFGSNAPIYFKKNQPGCVLRVNSKVLVSRLISLGITPRKSLTLIPPSALAFNKHYWRGEIDADGCLMLPKGSKGATIELVGSEQTILGFETFAKAQGLPVKQKISTHKNCFVKSICGKEATKLIEILYGDATVYLDRKYEIAKQIMAQRCKDNA